MTSRVWQVDTGAGPGRLLVSDPADLPPSATLMLGHGAGGGPDAPDLALLATSLPPRRVRVVRFEQPWRTAGRKVAAPPPRLDQAWRAAVEVVRTWDAGGTLFFGGRSAGARVACRTAAEYPVAGVVCLAFPLHPPGRPDRSRAAELIAAPVPRLVLQGTGDTFGGPEEVRLALAGTEGSDLVRVVELPGVDHGFRLSRASPLRPPQLRDLVATEVADFLHNTQSADHHGRE